MSSNLPPIPPKKTETDPRVKYVRNFDSVLGDMKPEDLMTDTLSNDFLYSTMAIGEQAAYFFTDTIVGADFDRRLREKFLKGFEALLAASPTDAVAVSDAQQECLVVLNIYQTVAAQIEDRHTAERELYAREDADDMETGE